MTGFDIGPLVRAPVRRLRAYPAHEIPCEVKLDANESPVGPSGALLKKIEEGVRFLELNRYPDPEGNRLRAALGRHLRVKSRCLLLGNGSDELISALITTFGGPVLYPVPTFAMYGIIAQGLGARVIEVPLDRRFGLSEKAMIREVKTRQPKLLFLSTPNNPTGNCFSRDAVLSIIGASKGIVVVDEAYQPFTAGGSFLRDLSRFPNLVVLRTLSKVGLAGIRLGILAAGESIVDEVNKVRLPFNVNSFTQMAAEKILSAGSFLSRTTLIVKRERKSLERGLAAIPGVTVFPSEANFVFFVVKEPHAVFDGLLSRGVLIRDLSALIPGGMRVTVGTTRENKRFLKAMKEVLG